MPTNIDTLQTATSNCQLELKNLKDNVKSVSLENANNLKIKLEKVKTDIESEITLLQNKTDSISLQEKEKAKNILVQVEQTINQAKKLQDCIKIRDVTSWEVSNTQSNPTIRDDVKLSLWNAINWGTEHRKWLTLSIWAVLWSTWLYKKLTKKTEDEEDDEDENNDEEEADEEDEPKEKKKKKKKKKSKSEKWFWDKWYGKVIKWTGISVWAWTLWYWIAKKFWWIKDGEMTDRTDNQASSTVELKEKDPEKFEKYKWIWEKVDSQYNQIMKKEIDSGWWWMSIADGYEKYAYQNNIDKDTFQATVPMCIDNEYADVNTFLSEWGYYSYLRWKNITALKAEILWWWKEKIGKFLWPFLSNLTSFIPFKWDDWAQAVEKWFEKSDATQISAELDFFFRQYAKVLNFVQDKKWRLMELIAEEKFRNTNNTFSTSQDALNDPEWRKEFIETDPRYVNFMWWKLYKSVEVMNDCWIYDDNLSNDMQDIVTTCDEERSRILNEKEWKDYLKRLDENTWNLSLELNKEWVEVCDNIVKDIEEEFDKSWIYMYFSCFDELTNSDENNLQEFLQHSGLNALKSALKESMWQYKQKFASWTISQEEIKDYKDLSNKYFAMKKEIFIWAEAIKDVKSDNSSIWERFLNTVSACCKDLVAQTEKSIQKFKDWSYLESWIAATFPLIVWGWALSFWWKVFNSSEIEKLWKIIQKMNMISVTSWQGMARIPWNLNYYPNRLLKYRYTWLKWDRLLLQDLIEWKIAWHKADEIIKKGVFSDKNIEDFIHRVWVTDANNMPSSRISMLFDGETPFMKNPSIRKFLVWEPKIWPVDTWMSLVRWFRLKTYKLDNLDRVKEIEKFMLDGESTKSIYKQLSKEQKTLFNQMIIKGDFEKYNLHDFLNNFKNNYSHIKLEEWTDVKQISKLADELCNNMDELGDVAKIKNRIGNVVWSTTEVLSDTKKAFNKIIDDAIDTLKELPETRIISVKINALNKLKNLDIAEDEMSSLIKLVDNWLKPKTIPLLVDLLNSEKEIKWLSETTDCIWDYMKQLLKEWKISEFNSLLKDSRVKTVFKDVDIDGVVKNLDSIITKFWSKLDDLWKLIKSTFKIIAKIL